MWDSRVRRAEASANVHIRIRDRLFFLFPLAFHKIVTPWRQHRGGEDNVAAPKLVGYGDIVPALLGLANGSVGVIVDDNGRIPWLVVHQKDLPGPGRETVCV